MKAELTNLLLGDATLAALVGDRVHWMRKAKSAGGTPYVNLQVIDDPENYHLRGVTTLKQTQIQCDVWGKTYSEMDAGQAALVALVSGFSGAIGNVNFQGIFVTGARDLDDETTGAESQLFRKSVDLEISWNTET